MIKMNHAIVNPTTTIYNTIKKMDEAPSKGGEIGIAVVVDSNDVLKGVVTDGDVRSAIAKRINLDLPIENIMSKNPIYVFSTYDLKRVLRESSRQMRQRKVLVHNIIIVNNDMKFIDILNLHKVYHDLEVSHRKIAVYGMGYVGLTLALTLAEDYLFDVVGIDTNAKVVSELNKGKPQFFEEGLVSLLNQTLTQKNITFVNDNTQVAADVHVISVGTPLNEECMPDMSYINNVVSSIGQVLKPGDLIICRSTVPVGTTRNYIIPLLEKKSGLKAGENFYIAFAPERTVEGQALQELRSLPQVVGGLTPRCADLAAKIFNQVTSTIVRVRTLEVAEIVKLINNTFRDLKFSFSNEVAYLCDKYNIDAFEVVDAANEGYPRDTIAKPSPGVGGACLTKDPILYTVHDGDNKFAEILLGKISRDINAKGPDYVIWQLEKFMNKFNISDNNFKILIVGLAFKGIPDTSDMRYSSSIEVLNKLKKMKYNILGYDAVVKKEDILALGIKPVTLQEGLKDTQAVIVMNNHSMNVRFDLYEGLMSMKKPGFFFDGWGMFNKKEIETVSGMTYATLGYNSCSSDATAS